MPLSLAASGLQEGSGRSGIAPKPKREQPGSTGQPRAQGELTCPPWVRASPKLLPVERSACRAGTRPLD